MRAKVDRLLHDLNNGNDNLYDENEPWKQDPFAIYGVGVHNFLTLNSRLVCVFLVMAVLACL